MTHDEIHTELARRGMASKAVATKDGVTIYVTGDETQTRYAAFDCSRFGVALLLVDRSLGHSEASDVAPHELSHACDRLRAWMKSRPVPA